MKDPLFKINSCFSLLFYLFFSFFLGSCEYYNFSIPQPVDRENIYEFPGDLCGNWTDENDSEVITINKNYVSFLNKETTKIVKGTWPVLNEKNDLVHTPFLYRSFYTVRFDSINRPIDTLTNYLLNGNNIYEVNEKGKLSRPYHYQTDHDTIILLKTDVVKIDIGQNAFLRKLNNDLYVMNIMNGILGEDNSWWQIIIIEQKSTNQINILECNGKMKKHPSMFYTTSIAKGTRNYYFDCNWTSGDIISLKDQGYFEISSELNRK
jgi:hypothetical protein